MLHSVASDVHLHPSPAARVDCPSGVPEAIAPQPPQCTLRSPKSSRHRVKESGVACSLHAPRRTHRRHRLGKVHDRPSPRGARRRRRRRGSDRARSAGAGLAGARGDRRRVRRGDAAPRRLAGSRGARRRACSATRRRSRGSTRSCIRPCAPSRRAASPRRSLPTPMPSSSTTCRCSSRRASTTRGSSSSWRTPLPRCACERLVGLRGMSPADAAARIASQVPDEARLRDRRRGHRHRGHRSTTRSARSTSCGRVSTSTCARRAERV